MNEQQIQDLIEKYFLEELNETEQAELRLALEAKRSYRDRFRRAAEIDAQLRHYWNEEIGTEESSPPSLPSEQRPHESESHEPIPRSVAGPQRVDAGWLTVAVAASLIAVVGVLYSGVWKPTPTGATAESAAVQPTAPQSDDDESATRDSSEVAWLVTGYNHRFNDGLSPQNNSFDMGDYELTDGSITLRFDSGVDVSIESPARFTIVNSLRMKMDAGRARAIVPETGHGFVIQTPTADVEDLGTEFGVYVSEEQDVELHVFAGEVNVHTANHPSRRILEDTAVHLTSTGTQQISTTDDVAFTTRSKIGYQRWLADSTARREDPSTLLYFDFEPVPDAPTLLRDRSQSGLAIDGQIQGCIWATGRWPNKGALLLERAGDRVELDLPGTFDALTISGWIQVNRFDQALQAFFNTRDWQPGEHHWNIQRNGGMSVGVSRAYTIHSVQKKVPLGRWTHLAASIDAQKRVATYYIDGEPAQQRQWDNETSIVFGPCTIGAFGSTVTDPGTTQADEEANAAEPSLRVETVRYNRELRGRIDELAIFEGAFSTEQVKDLYEAGNGFD
ncbi:LamG-like jellyroll fold domain-containing protein [Rhodopirellula sp. P2]|uniref:LamG-like jellyroll fold domain-containing protein n=1 Tax=Rhodopirellula sp. P2 TaxID=2127060 RepID=UPI0023686147|nr:LamG-like jellyroll fold domain-containing protein [Rhodopirellula sp. P2]WDQ16009.1 FecR domain-containing protein [Rhodopirellula sp. P2]